MADAKFAALERAHALGALSDDIYETARARLLRKAAAPAVAPAPAADPLLQPLKPTANHLAARRLRRAARQRPPRGRQLLVDVVFRRLRRLLGDHRRHGGWWRPNCDSSGGSATGRRPPRRAGARCGAETRRQRPRHRYDLGDLRRHERLADGLRLVAEEVELVGEAGVRHMLLLAVACRLLREFSGATEPPPLPRGRAFLVSKES